MNFEKKNDSLFHFSDSAFTWGKEQRWTGQGKNQVKIKNLKT